MINGIGHRRNLLEDKSLLPISTQVCTICRDPRIGELERAWIDRTKSVQDIMEELDVTKYKWYHHVKHHLKPEIAMALSSNAEILAAQTIDKVGETVDQLDRLKGKIKLLDEAMTGHSIDHNTMKVWLSLETAITKNIETLAKIQGEYKDATIINAQNITIEYNQFNQMVMQEACSVCKAKFAEHMNDDGQIIKVIPND